MRQIGSAQSGAIGSQTQAPEGEKASAGRVGVADPLAGFSCCATTEIAEERGRSTRGSCAKRGLLSEPNSRTAPRNSLPNQPRLRRACPVIVALLVRSGVFFSFTLVGGRPQGTVQ